ncbi:STAS domain-containing protein [Streptomyces sp. NBC_01314]|nr:STAS domain-containing protein [Streptomyces sp. NBC_01314]
MAFEVTDGEQSEQGEQGARSEWAVLHVSGEMDLVTSPQLRQRVHEAVADGHRSLVIDLSGVVFCDSSGVGVLVATRRLMRSCRGRLRLILPADGHAGGPAEGAHVNRVLAALGVRRLFDVHPDVPSAVAPESDDEADPLSA